MSDTNFRLIWAQEELRGAMKKQAVALDTLSGIKNQDGTYAAGFKAVLRIYRETITAAKREIALATTPAKSAVEETEKSSQPSTPT